MLKFFYGTLAARNREPMQARARTFASSRNDIREIHRESLRACPLH